MTLCRKSIDNEASSYVEVAHEFVVIKKEEFVELSLY